MKFLQALYILIFLVAVILWTRDIVKSIALNSKSKKWRFIRSLYWTVARNRVADGLHNWKVRGYLAKYLRDSVAAKEYYLNCGYVNLHFAMIGKVEELERFVEKYKYNTFDNLSISEKDYIDNYLKEQNKKQ